MTTTEIGLSLGGNLGDRLAVLGSARRAICSIPGVDERSASRVYETEPVGVLDEYRHLPYLNAVLVVSCGCGVHAFARACRDVEFRLGRVRGEDRYAPRTSDIDLIYADAREVHDAELRLPHPRWHERRFVVQPLAEVRPQLVLPGQVLTVEQILSELPATPGATLFSERW